MHLIVWYISRKNKTQPEYSAVSVAFEKCWMYSLSLYYSGIQNAGLLHPARIAFHSPVLQCSPGENNSLYLCLMLYFPIHTSRNQSKFISRTKTSLTLFHFMLKEVLHWRDDVRGRRLKTCLNGHKLSKVCDKIFKSYTARCQTHSFQPLYDKKKPCWSNCPSSISVIENAINKPGSYCKLDLSFKAMQRRSVTRQGVIASLLLLVNLTACMR